MCFSDLNILLHTGSTDCDIKRVAFGSIRIFWAVGANCNVLNGAESPSPIQFDSMQLLLWPDLLDSVCTVLPVRWNVYHFQRFNLLWLHGVTSKMFIHVPAIFFVLLSILHHSRTLSLFFSFSFTVCIFLIPSCFYAFALLCFQILKALG